MQQFQYVVLTQSGRGVRPGRGQNRNPLKKRDLIEVVSVVHLKPDNTLPLQPGRDHTDTDTRTCRHATGDTRHRTACSWQRPLSSVQLHAGNADLPPQRRRSDGSAPCVPEGGAGAARRPGRLVRRREWRGVRAATVSCSARGCALSAPRLSSCFPLAVKPVPYTSALSATHTLLLYMYDTHTNVYTMHT